MINEKGKKNDYFETRANRVQNKRSRFNIENE